MIYYETFHCKYLRTDVNSIFLKKSSPVLQELKEWKSDLFTDLCKYGVEIGNNEEKEKK